jgi:hypothetical protein
MLIPTLIPMLAMLPTEGIQIGSEQASTIFCASSEAACGVSAATSATGCPPRHDADRVVRNFGTLRDDPEAVPPTAAFSKPQPAARPDRQFAHHEALVLLAPILVRPGDALAKGHT